MVYISFFSTWFFLGFITIFPIFPIDMTVADRWYYFPFIGLLGMTGACIHLLSINNKHLKIIGIIIAVLFLSGYSIRTIIRNSDWKDNMTLYSHDVKNTENYLLELNLAVELAAVEKYDEALVHTTKSIEIFPNEVNYGNIGYLYNKKHNSQKAREYYAKAYNSNHYLPTPQRHLLNTYSGYGASLIINDKNRDASKVLKEGLQEYPQDSNLWTLLAINEYNLDNQKDALAAAERAVSISPNQQTHNILQLIKNKQQVILSQ